MLKDGRYDFRPIREDDLERLALHRNSPSTWKNLTTPLPVYPHRQRGWLEGIGYNDMYFIGRYEHVDVGLLRVTDIDWVNRNCAVGIDIFEEHRGMWHATPLFRLICRYAIKELNMHRLWLLVLRNNFIAINVYTKVGFKKEGVFKEHIYRNGRWEDYILMGVLEHEFIDTSAE